MLSVSESSASHSSAETPEPEGSGTWIFHCGSFLSNIQRIPRLCKARATDVLYHFVQFGGHASQGFKLGSIAVSVA